MARTEVDRVLLAKLTGVARHLVNEPPGGEQSAAAVEELRLLAGGRTDLLAELAGISLGVGESALDADRYRRTADLAIAAGADENLIEYWTGVGRYRAEMAKILPSAGVLRRQWRSRRVGTAADMGTALLPGRLMSS
jgi:hypothetical protein